MKRSPILPIDLPPSPQPSPVSHAAGPTRSTAPLLGRVLLVEDNEVNAIVAFMDRLKMIVPGTSLGDVHSLLLYPVMASHRNVSPKMRERVGIRDNLVRLAAGIEAPDDIIGDLDAALSSV